MDSDPASSLRQSNGPWFCSAVTLWTVWDLLIAPVADSYRHNQYRGFGMRRFLVSSYLAKGLNGTGFSCSPCQTVPHGGWGVGRGVERVLFS